MLFNDISDSITGRLAEKFTDSIPLCNTVSACVLELHCKFHFIYYIFVFLFVLLHRARHIQRLISNAGNEKLTIAAAIFGIMLVSPQLPLTPLVFWHKLALSSHSVVWQCTLVMVSLPLTIVRCIVVMTHPYCRQPRAGQIVVFWVQLWLPMTQVPDTDNINSYILIHFVLLYQSWGLRPRSYDKTGLRQALVLVLVFYFWSC